MTPDPTPFPLDHLTLRGERGAPALTVGEATLSYAELDDAVGRNAAALLARGLVPGDRVASWMGKTMLACVLPLAAARAGLVHVPINPVLRRAQAAHILADGGARLLIANGARLDSLEDGDLGQAAPVALEAWLAPGPGLPPSSCNTDTLAALLYTSGSTGRPKG
ncbi:MAG: long-chain fatty acid--CoA ligase, partial [Pseudomonadota bacterium]|nr:long-chain fatty acid--CoA ligase [Pseudomonadota bacterium]